MTNGKRGFTLIEMVVAISICATLAGIAVLLLHALVKSHKTGREHLEYCHTINRLAEQFRADVHAMQKTASDNNETVFDLQSESADDTKIRFQCFKDRIDRTELQGEKVVRQESYMLPPDMEASIKTQSFSDATIARIIISPKDKMETGVSSGSERVAILFATPVRIEAALGRDSRLSKIQSAAEGKP